MWCCGKSNARWDESTPKCAFAHGNLKANGDIFEEYYDLEAMNVFRYNLPIKLTRSVMWFRSKGGERISIRTALMWLFCVRGQRYPSVTRRIRIIPLADFAYNDVAYHQRPWICSSCNKCCRWDAFRRSFPQRQWDLLENFFNKWVDFETYRRIVFKDEHWTE